MENTQTAVENPSPVVTFPTAPAPKGGMPKWPFAAGGVLLILGIGGFFLMQANKSGSEEEATPTPYVSGLSSIETPEPTEAPSATAAGSPTPSAAPVTDTVRAAQTIEIQNGTGTSGDAGVAKKQLDTLGYKKVTTGNATDTSATVTTITYTKDVPASVIAEITTSLEAVFASVTAQKGVLSGTTTIRIVTGPKKAGSAAKATPTATAKATATPTVKPTATPLN